MSEKSTRPTFDDPLPTEAQIHKAIETRDLVGKAEDPSLAALGDLDLTPEQSASAAKVMFEPTVKRLVILVDNLIHLAGNGDFALWAPLAAIDAAIKGLDWSSASVTQRLKFLALVAQTLSHYGARMDEHREAIERSLEESGAAETAGALPDWTIPDTLEMYNIVDAMYPAPIPDGVIEDCATDIFELVGDEDEPVEETTPPTGVEDPEVRS